MVAVGLLLLLLGISVGVALVLGFHYHGGAEPYLGPDLEAMEAVDRLFEGSALARLRMLEARPQWQSPENQAGDQTP